MRFLVVMVAAWLAGYFFSALAVLFVSMVCGGLWIMMVIRFQGFEKKITFGYVVHALPANFLMWFTYFVLTGQTPVGTFLHRYVLR